MQIEEVDVLYSTPRLASELSILESPRILVDKIVGGSMPFRILFAAAAFLLAAAIPLQGQWGTGSRIMRIRDPAQICPGVLLEVKDSSGRAIGEAIIVSEDNGMRYATDIQGTASIPCGHAASMMRIIEVHASGFKSSTITLLPNTQSRIEVILAKEDPMPQHSMFAVDVEDLKNPARKEVKHLQTQAAAALHYHDYSSAEKLYLQALRTSPSDASIPNNLGVLALRRGDFKAGNTWFEMAMQLDPYTPDYALNLGILRWMQGRRDESYSLLLLASDRGYEPDSSHYIQGVVSLERGLYKEAARHLKKVSEDRFPYRNLFLSMALRHLGKAKSAEETFLSFLRRNPFPFAYMPPIIQEPTPTGQPFLGLR